MIVRDEYGVIVQHPIDANSGGDSCIHTSISAILGVQEDVEDLDLFVKDGMVIRHPFNDKYKNPHDPKEGSSRDQTTMWFAACHFTGQHELARQVKFKLFIVHDFIAPDLQWMYAKAKKSWTQYLWAIIGYPWTVLSIWYTCNITPNHELNQLLVQCAVAGRPFVESLKRHHPNWKQNLLDYWGWGGMGHGKWRDRGEWAIGLIKWIN